VIATHNRLLQLYYIRHGETAGLSRPAHGSDGHSVDCAWRRRGARTEPCLRKIKFARVLTSPRQRARRTCELTGFGASAVSEPDLSEWTMATTKDGAPWTFARSDRTGMCFGWLSWRETPEQISARADRLISHLQSLQGNVALFAHGQFGCVLAARWIGLTAIKGRHFALGAASLSILGYETSTQTLS